jgi:hypothetical protein
MNYSYFSTRHWEKKISPKVAEAQRNAKKRGNRTFFFFASLREISFSAQNWQRRPHTHFSHEAA